MKRYGNGQENRPRSYRTARHGGDYAPRNSRGPARSAAGGELLRAGVRLQHRGYRVAAERIGPFGVVVLNHGVGATREARLRESPEFFLHSAAAFAARGY